jgi:hypothetical protein
MKRTLPDTETLLVALVAALVAGGYLALSVERYRLGLAALNIGLFCWPIVASRVYLRGNKVGGSFMLGAFVATMVTILAMWGI